VDVRVDAAWKHQHALRLDHAGTSRGSQVRPNFSNRAVANAQIAFCAADRGHDKSITDDQLGRLLRDRICHKRKQHSQEDR
jgi:hypothetical protein